MAAKKAPAEELTTVAGVRAALLAKAKEWREPTDKEEEDLDGWGRQQYFAAGYRKALQEFAARLRSL